MPVIWPAGNITVLRLAVEEHVPEEHDDTADKTQYPEKYLEWEEE